MTTEGRFTSVAALSSDMWTTLAERDANGAPVESWKSSGGVRERKG